MRKPIPRSAPPKRVNAVRKKRNWHHAHHSMERCGFVKSLPCIVVGCLVSPVDVMHIESGGMGKKAHYTKTVPACNPHHRYAHQRGIATFLAHFPVKAPLDQLAAYTQAAWEEYAEG